MGRATLGRGTLGRGTLGRGQSVVGRELPVILSAAKDLLLVAFAPKSRSLRSLPMALCAMLTACIHGKLPPQEYYRLHLPEKTDSIAAATPDAAAPSLTPGGIAIVPYVAPGLYGNRNIVFRVDEASYGSYPNREWALPVPTMLGMLTEDIFRARPLTRDPAVFDPPSPHTYAYVWRGLVRELEEVDRGHQVFAVVRF